MYLKYYILILTVLVSISGTFHAQQAPATKLDSIQQEISKLKKEHEKEFEERVSAEIEEKFLGQITKWFGLVSLALAILGGFGIKFSKDYLKNYVTKMVTETVSKTVSEEYNKIGLEQQKFIFEYKLVDIKKNTDEKEALDMLTVLFEKVLLTKDEHLIENYLDHLIRLNFTLRKYEDLTKLVQKFEKDYPISETTWANVAIANMYLYIKYGAPEYREMALRACDNSLKVMPNYGEPQAVKLFVNIFSHDKTSDPVQKETYRKKCKEIIDQINSGEDTITSSETYNYMMNKTGSMYHPLIETLLKLFPEEIDLLKRRYDYSIYAENGLRCEDSGDNPGAIENYVRAIEFYPSDLVTSRLTELLKRLLLQGVALPADKSVFIEKLDKTEIKEESKKNLISIINRF